MVAINIKKSRTQIDTQTHAVTHTLYKHKELADYADYPCCQTIFDISLTLDIILAYSFLLTYKDTHRSHGLLPSWSLVSLWHSNLGKVRQIKPAQLAFRRTINIILLTY